MATKNALTNQKLGERFDNAFTLVNYAIGLAKTLIQRGEELPQNPANMVLDSIAENRDLFETKEEKEEEVTLPEDIEKELEEEKPVVV